MQGLKPSCDKKEEANGGTSADDFCNDPRRAQLISDAVPALIFCVDKDGRFRFCNRAYSDWFGLSTKEVLEKPMPEVLGNDAWGKIQPHFETALAGKLEEFEAEVRYQRGGLRWIHAAYTPCRDSAENVIAVVGLVTDITERKHHEQKLAEQARLLDLSSDAMIVRDMDGRIAFWNRGAEEIYGWKREEAVGKTCAQLLRTVFPKPLSEITFELERDSRWSGEVIQTRRDNTRITVSTRWTLDRANGHPAAILETNSDITERKRVETALRQSEERFRQLGDNIAPLAWMTDADGWMYWFNKRWYEYTGTTLEEMQGLGWEKVHHPDHFLRASEKWNAHLQSGEAWEDTFPLRGKDGNYRWFLSRAFPIRDEHGKIMRWFGTNTDIQDLRESQESLAESERRYRELVSSLEKQVKERTASLEEMNKQLEAFTYTIAHDLRAPLRAQQSFAHALLDDYGNVLDETGRDYADRIIASAIRLNDLVSDLLTFSRISRADMKLDAIDLRNMVRNVCEEMTFNIREANSKLQIEQFNFRVRGHEVTLRTAITNLLSNAIKFTKPGIAPEIHIWAEERGKSIRLWIEDNGIGIAPEHHLEIFGIFHRLHKVGEYPGTGVGLAIVQRGIERMGGHVGVESQKSVGSRFWIELEKAD